MARLQYPPAAAPSLQLWVRPQKSWLRGGGTKWALFASSALSAVKLHVAQAPGPVLSLAEPGRTSWPGWRNRGWRNRGSQSGRPTPYSTLNRSLCKTPPETRRARGGPARPSPQVPSKSPLSLLGLAQATAGGRHACGPIQILAVDSFLL